MASSGHSLIGLIVSQSRDAAAQRQQRRVDVVRLLHSLAVLLGFTALRPRQVTHREPAGNKTHDSSTLKIDRVRSNTAITSVDGLTR